MRVSIRKDLELFSHTLCVTIQNGREYWRDYEGNLRFTQPIIDPLYKTPGVDPNTLDLFTGIIIEDAPMSVSWRDVSPGTDR